MRMSVFKNLASFIFIYSSLSNKKKVQLFTPSSAEQKNPTSMPKGEHKHKETITLPTIITLTI